MRSTIREVLETLIAAVLLFFVVQSLVQNFQVEGPSMEPTIHSGQLLLINKAIYMYAEGDMARRFLPFVDVVDDELYFFHPPRRGDIVVFQDPQTGEYRIKRIIGIPGDVVEIRRGETLLDGYPMEEPYVETEALGSWGPQRLSPDSYFVMGDNRLYSRDSRSTGPVQGKDIIGKAWISFWPPSELGFLKHYSFLARSE